jgi:hypothetical protein
MELVTISLNTEKQAMFFLPNKLHLTFENPGPVEIDPSTLTEQEKAWINQAYKQTVLFVENPNKKEDQVQPPPVSVEEAKVEARTPVKTTDQVFNRRDESTKQAKALLTGKVSAIKEAISASNDILLLRLMKETEAGSKKRKSVLASLDEQLDLMQTGLYHEIGGEQGEVNQFVMDANLRNLPEVEEIAEKTITIKPLGQEDV